jgi:small-conductance mechanosensitive channel
MTLADILRLIAAADEPADHLKKLFEWRVERAMTAVRLTAAAVGAVLASLVAALLRSSGTVAGWVIALVGASVLLGLAYAWSRYDEARRSEREYVVALNLVRELKPLTPLIRLYPDLNVD